MEQTYSERESEFAESWSGYEGDDIAELLRSAGERLAALCLNDPAVDEAMTVLHQKLGLPGYPVDYHGPQNWRTLWGETSGGDLDTIPLAQKTTGLHAYAYFGLSPKNRCGRCLIDDIKAAIELVKDAVLRAVDAPETPELDRTILAAEGRLALDQGRRIPLEQLAALAKVGMKSIRNAAAPSSGSGLEIGDGGATPESATRWLVARDDFKSSIWSRAGEEDDEAGVALEKLPEIEGEILWVPFASDGSEFHPQTCFRGGGYTIGPKSAEEKINDYRTALERLARMRPGQYWRRPNSAGNWGIVTAVGFRPRTADELGLNSTGGGK